MLWRFSLYGFLKNQQYYEPFFLLVLREKGMTFLQIGLLFAFREAWINVLGVPVGFIADLYGRRTSLVVCFCAYVASFAGFALTSSPTLSYLAMFAFAVGESFRSGTHKAMIFHHLRLEGRESDKTRVYGFTRSWSKIGSSVSALLSGVLVFLSGAPSSVFLWAIPPYLLNAANVAAYPRRLEGETRREGRRLRIRDVLSTMSNEVVACFRSRPLRGIFLESAVLQATVKTAKDYVQPLVAVAFASWSARSVLGQVDTTRRSALLLGVVYFILNAGAAWASRNAWRFDAIERRRFPWLWAAVAVAGLLVAAGGAGGGGASGAAVVAVGGFVLLVLLENLWRPLFLDRLDEVSDSAYGAAILSVEAQCASLGKMACAPAVGWIADHAGTPGVGLFAVGLAGFAGLASLRRKLSTSGA